MNTKPSILIIEDDANLVMILERFLTSLRYYTIHSYTGKEGSKIALSNRYDLLIIDIGLPDISGLEVIKNVKSINNKPIIVITGEDESEIELNSYRAKGNIFHKKPVKLELLEAQIVSLLPDESFSIIKSLDLSIDIGRRMIEIKNTPIYLTKCEFNLLLMLLNSRGEVFSREVILSRVMNYYSNSSESSVNTLISRLRKKLRKSNNQIIQTIPKIGYCINPMYIENIVKE